MPNLTQTIGLGAYVLALASCCAAWSASRRKVPKDRLAVILSILEAALLADMWFGVRLQLHALLVDQAVAHSVYSRRVWIQIPALVVLSAAGSSVVVAVLWCFRNRLAGAIAICGVIASIGCWGLEVISFHSIDALLYRPLGGTMVISVFWVAGALITSIGILLDTRRMLHMRNHRSACHDAFCGSDDKSGCPLLGE